MNAITLPRSVLEQALEALESGIQYDYHGNPYSDNDAARCVASDALRAALEQPQVEQEPAPNGATHRQPKQGAFYKRVDGKWYVWSRMENGEPHRWYISPGTSESCLEPLNAAAPQPPAVKDSLTAEQPQSVTDCHQSQPQVEQESVAHSIVAGALFDFMGWLTSRDDRLVLSSTDDAVPAVEVITAFAKMRGLSLDEAMVRSWQDSRMQQPKREPLTDEQIRDVAFDVDAAYGSVIEFARAIERAHGIGGEA